MPKDARPRRFRRLRIALLALAGLALLVLLGPRVAVEEPVGAPSLGLDLEGELAASEARFDDLLPGTEKRIVWADPERPATTPWAVVYLHGFSATRREVAPLFDQVAADLGANLYYARLRGHGRPGAALGDVTVRDWLEDAWEAHAIGRRLGRRVLLAGTSTGGTLATWLAARHPGDVGALVLISPNYEPRDPRWRWLLRPWAPVLVPRVFGSEWGFDPVNDAHARWWTTRYPTRALLAVAGLTDLVGRIDGGDVDVPTLVFVTDDDRIVDPAATRRRVASFAAPARVETVDGVLDPQRHVLAGEVLSPSTTPLLRARIVRFVRELGERSSGAGGP